MPNPNLAEARAKGLTSPNIGKRGPSKKTLQKEEIIKKAAEGLVRAYRADLIKEFTEIRRTRLEEAKKPRNVQERKYVFDDVEKPADMFKFAEGLTQKHLHLHQYEEIDESLAASIVVKLADEFEKRLRDELGKKENVQLGR